MRWDWRAFLGLAVSVLLIWWVLRDVDAAEVWREVGGANWWLLLAAVAVATSGFLTRALRWKVFLQPLHAESKLSNRFAAVNIGFAANNLLPARAGEFVRAWSISRLEPVTVSGAVGSLVAERFLDAVAVFTLLGVSMLHPAFPSTATITGRSVESVVLGLLVVMMAVFLGLIGLLFVPGSLLARAGGLTRFVPGHPHRRLRDLARSFIQGLESLRNPRLFLVGLAWSLGIWAWNGVSFWLAFLAFGIDQSYATALFVQAVISLGVSVPSAPGYFGTFHAAAVIGLHEVYGVAEEATLAFAFGYHLGGFFPVTLLGLWYAGRIGLSISDLRHAEEVVEEELHEHPMEDP